MPYPNQHSCRLKDPSLFNKDSFRTLHTKTKGLSFISGRLKSTGKSAVQAYRYDKKVWNANRARKHCSTHNGSFEQAVKKSLTPSDVPNLLQPGGNTAFQGKGEKGLAYKLCLLENKERGKTSEESKKICSFLKELSLSEKSEKNEHYLDLPEGSMTFVYHRKWDDVDESEARNIEEMINFNNTLTGELKFDMGKDLLNYTIHLGEPIENYPEDKFIGLNGNKKLETSLSERQNKDWLHIKDLSMRKEVDEEHESWSTYFLVDKGQYKQGVKRKHFQEFFLDGKFLKGRYIFMYARISKTNTSLLNSQIEKLFFDDVDNSINLEDRIWLLQKPVDQRPYAETHKMEDVIAELKTKNQKWLVWSSPNIEAEKIDIEQYDLTKKRIDLFANKD